MTIIIFVLELIILYFISQLIKRKISGRIYGVLKSKKWTAIVYAILFLPGTFIHEISHFLAALLLFVPVGNIDLTPNIEVEEIKLGSVAIAKVDPVRRFMVGFAPVIFGLGIILLMGFFLTGNKCIFSWCPGYLIRILISGFIIFQISNSMFSSKKDLEGAWVLLVLILLIAVTLYFLGIRIGFESNSFLIVKISEIVKQINYLLLIPIGVNTFLLTLAKIFR